MMLVHENHNIIRKDVESMNMQTNSALDGGIHMTGHIVDRIFDKNGNLINTIEGHNLVVNSFLNMVMALAKGEAGYSGIGYWAIGSGEDSWDSSTPDPDITATHLTTEIGRVAIAPSEIKFLDSDNTESNTPTNILQIKHMFTNSECNGKWREFGLFGGNATETADSGILINKRHHSIITKTSDMSIERTMTFTLSLTQGE